PEVKFTKGQNVLINSMTRLKHLSCPRENETGLGSKEDSTAEKEDTLAMMSLVSDQKLEQGGFESLPFKSTNAEVIFGSIMSLPSQYLDMIHLFLSKVPKTDCRSSW